GLPSTQMLGPVEIPARDGRELSLRDPAEYVVAVQELESVDDLRGPGGLLREASSAPRCRECPVEGVRVGGDQRCPCRSRFPESVVEPGANPDEAPQPARACVTGAAGILVLDRQLEAGDEDEPVLPYGALGLGIDLGKVRGKVVGPNVQALCAPHDVIGDDQNVEAGHAVKVDDLPHAELTVAPRRVGVELGEKRSACPWHPLICSAAARRLCAARWLRSGTEVVK